MLWRWAKRRHPNKNSRWVRRRYFSQDGYWTFREGKAQLLRPDATPITRFVKVEGRRSPYDPTLRDYWQKRGRRNLARITYVNRKRMLLNRQDYRCAHCGRPFEDEQIQEHHVIPRNTGGNDDLDNVVLVHPWCHHQHHQRHGYKVLKARAG